jgi:hypothetical protein
VRDANLVRILCGADDSEPFGGQAGVVVDLDVVPPDVERTAPAPSAPLSPGTAFRSAPLFAILDTDAGRLMVIGHCQVTVDPHRAPVVRVLTQALWLASRGADAPRRRLRRLGPGADKPSTTDHNWRMVPGFDRLRDVLVPWFRDNPHLIPAAGEGRATVIAKAIAESSRDEVYTVRALRYELERGIGANLRRLQTQDLEIVLADIVELTVAVSRARDEAAEAWRDGLSSWRSNPAAYHAQRRLQDPTLPRRAGARRARRQPWFPVLDAGVRQCRAMDQLLTEEAALMHQLLDATASVSAARDAQAQETFTMIAAVGGVLIGMPALIIALYGATAVLPINTSNARVLLPVAATGFVAGLLAAFLPGRERVGKVWRFFATLLATAAMVILLVLAGSLVNPER